MSHMTTWGGTFQAEETATDMFKNQEGSSHDFCVCFSHLESMSDNTAGGGQSRGMRIDKVVVIIIE